MPNFSFYLSIQTSTSSKLYPNKIHSFEQGCSVAFLEQGSKSKTGLPKSRHIWKNLDLTVFQEGWWLLLHLLDTRVPNASHPREWSVILIFSNLRGKERSFTYICMLSRTRHLPMNVLAGAQPHFSFAILFSYAANPLFSNL